MLSEEIKNELKQELRRTGGILFGEQTLVGRGSYCGKNFLAPNSKPTDVDERGYWLVERWILSIVQTANPVMKTGEGLTKLRNVNCSLSEAVHEMEEELFGSFKTHWPLIKILDIGGQKIATSFGTIEEPPIPAHIHAGCTKGNVEMKCGKAEAQFFPPCVGESSSVITRMGFRKGTTKEILKNAMKNFGKSDDVYEIMNSYEMKENECWMVRPGFVHAPGPKLTIEIQRAQDDFNFLCWKLGERIPTSELKSVQNDHQLRGLKSIDSFIEKCIDWDMNIDPNADKIWKKTKCLLEENDSFKKSSIFFDMFYGEEWIIKNNAKWTLKNCDTPLGCLVWSGKGSLNEIDVKAMDEFLITPNANLEFYARNGDCIIVKDSIFLCG